MLKDAVLLAVNDFPTDAEHMTEEDIKKYINEHGNEFDQIMNTDQEEPSGMCLAHKSAGSTREGYNFVLVFKCAFLFFKPNGTYTEPIAQDPEVREEL